MKSKKEEAREPSPTELLAVAAEKVEAWQNANVILEDARRREASLVTPGIRNNALPALLARKVAEIDVVEADHAASRLALEASEALSVAARAEGDELERAVDLTRVRDELLALDAEERRLANELVEVKSRQRATIDRAVQSTRSLQARRSADGLPPPHSWPTAPYTVGSTESDTRKQIAAIDRRLAEGPRPAKDCALRLRQLRLEERDLRAEIERGRLAREERDASAAADARFQEQQREREARTARENDAELQAQIDASNAEVESLANAHRARELAGEVAS
jgi:hypothetical protein